MKNLIATIILSVSLTAYADMEYEPNDSLSSAQELQFVGSSASVSGNIGRPGETVTDDLDFYSFYATAGDVVTVDVDNGYSTANAVNTLIGVFDPNGNLIRMNAYSRTVDEGSTSILDPYIDRLVIAESGRYVVGVSNVPRYFITGGSILAFFGKETTSMGSYDLIISGATMASRVIDVSIEVKPGNDQLARLNPRSKGKVPVAILGSLSFSVFTIDEKSLTFGHTGQEQSLHKCGHPEDVNGDGNLDLVCHFENQMLGLRSGDIEGILIGKTSDGKIFRGESLLKVLPTQK